MDSFYSNDDARRMWQGLQHITDYRPTMSSTISPSGILLLNDLNTSYTCFETSNINTEWRHKHTGTTQPPFSPPTVSSAVVQKSLRKINPHNTARQDIISGQALRACATGLADVLTSIFKI
ncbi:uncharacterized protein LOC118599185 [Tachysurus ichikawai]